MCVIYDIIVFSIKSIFIFLLFGGGPADGGNI